MRNIRLILPLFCSVVILFSCSGSDDNNDGQEPLPETNADYFPLSVNNFWNYDVDATESGRDSIYVQSQTSIGGTGYFQMNAREPNYGLFTSLVAGNAMRKSDGKLYLRGVLGGVMIGTEELEIPIADVVLFDENAAVDDVLYQESGSQTSEIEGFTITIEYELTTRVNSVIEQYPLGGITYNDVLETSIVLSAQGAVSGTVNNIPFDTPILLEQNLIEGSLYFAPDVGMIRSEVVIGYELANFELLQQYIEVPLEESFSESNIQTISNYEVTLEN